MRVIYDIVRDGLGTINRAAEELQAAREQVGTGRRISSPSDDPLATQQSVGEHAALAAIDGYTRTRDSAAARLAAADQVITGFVDKLTAAIVTATGARNSNASEAQRAAAAQSLRGLRDSLVTDINSRFNGSALFAGSATDAQPYANVGGSWVYQGSGDAVQVEIEQGRLVSVAFNGQALAQGTDSSNVFTVLDDLAAAIEAGDSAAVGTQMAALDSAFNRALVAQGRLGADERGVDDAALRLQRLRTAAEARRSRLEDVNMAEAVTRLSAADTAYRAALGAVSSAERLSLLDYLR